ncbi:MULTISPECIES: GNAT family N-acetyltransferase [Lactiplantibacillus]|uniref:GNAT family N-acetyltransferase n=2 Tax=Lactiplantibacillus argentoratensis TaxID=271881 RepID=A0ABS5UJP8_9LACO|nr:MULTISPECIES: GNAT family N-acetyltransferase [Lactiplantibacillus]KRL90357.1 ribosomal protein acetylating enzyme [Lactiplantibacillus argentoratensis DSM 16365]KON41283.1 ribosomal protein serine-acetylating enzyme [Lactiplantibacillus plantarum]MBP5809652.1 GNAT family N-acetyltransferase [Lactiplantibacillus argentoratensis]MBT1138808.1 GNAT family N-acetyltransferase [Lactiplantibacillus argentoratensis]MBT1141653.1 GNAT family N-acetyltransferase [Lactiplantibacillus argentoratensis]
MFMLTYRVTPAIELREPLPQSDAPALLALLTANRAQYQYYLPWVAKIQTVADEQRFLTVAQLQLQWSQALNLVIVVEQRVAGMVSCDHFDDNDHSANIGYWLGRPFQGRGVMTAAVRGVCDLGFNQYHRQCLRIRAAVDNQASNAVAQRAGFGFLIQHSGGQHLLDGDHDENVYQVSAVDWLAKRHK